MAAVRTESSTRSETTRVAIVGGGPAGLMLSHLLARSGIDSVVIERRTRAEIHSTVRAGILESGSVNMLVDSGVSDRVLRDGDRHDGIELRFDGTGHRIDFQELAGESVWLYQQTDVFADLADARARDGGDVRFSVRDVTVSGVTDAHPAVAFTESDGSRVELRCDVVIGADGSHSACRTLIPETHRRTFYREYPFAWFGILTQAPRSAEELVYAASDRGFALISQRSDTVQRMYFQCDPSEDAEQWSDAKIWDELQSRVAGDGFALTEGPITDRVVLPFRSFVCEPLRHGSLFLVGDAGHTVPPTGAKGLNLALADVAVLHEALVDLFEGGNASGVDAYSDRALSRVWKSQHFSYWMTTLLHDQPDASDFDRRRQRGERESIVSSRAGSAFLAEGYTGWQSTPATAQKGRA